MQHVKIFSEADDETKIWGTDDCPTEAQSALILRLCLSIWNGGLNYAEIMVISVNMAIVLCVYFPYNFVELFFM